MIHFARVLIVEDEPDIARLIALSLKRVVQSTVIAPDAEAAIHVLNADYVDLILLDWMLPGISGVELCRRIRSGTINPGFREIPILMVTARDEPQDIVYGLDAGADDYLVKPFDIEELIARCIALLRRKEHGPKSIIRIGALCVALPEKSVFVGDRKIELTPTEYVVLNALLSHRGRVLSRDRLVRIAAATDPSLVLESNVDLMIFSLQRKLGSSASLIEVVRGVGYRVAHS